MAGRPLTLTPCFANVHSSRLGLSALQNFAHLRTSKYLTLPRDPAKRRGCSICFTTALPVVLKGLVLSFVLSVLRGLQSEPTEAKRKEAVSAHYLLTKGIESKHDHQCLSASAPATIPLRIHKGSFRVFEYPASARSLAVKNIRSLECFECRDMASKCGFSIRTGLHSSC